MCIQSDRIGANSKVLRVRGESFVSLYIFGAMGSEVCSEWVESQESVGCSRVCVLYWREEGKARGGEATMGVLNIHCTSG